MNFFKLYPGDYGAKTAHLTLMEHGAYLLLLQQHYTTERPLTTDTKMLARIIRADTAAERKAIERVLSEFWTLTGEGWVNPRALEEIERASRQREINRELGKRGGRPPKNRTVTEHETDSVSDSEPIRKPNHNPNQTPDSKTLRPSAVPEKDSGVRAVAVQPAKTASPPAADPPNTKRATRLPPDWELPPLWREWAARERPDLNPDDTAARFRDYWVAKPGSAGTKLDWQATWRNWVRDERAQAPRPSTRAPVIEARNRDLSAQWTPPELREVAS